VSRHAHASWCLCVAQRPRRVRDGGDGRAFHWPVIGHALACAYPTCARQRATSLIVGDRWQSFYFRSLPSLQASLHASPTGAVRAVRASGCGQWVGRAQGGEHRTAEKQHVNWRLGQLQGSSTAAQRPWAQLRRMWMPAVQSGCWWMLVDAGGCWRMQGKSTSKLALAL
jgi:hypothetical protein